MMQSHKDDTLIQKVESPRCWSPAQPVDSPRFSFARISRKKSAAALRRCRRSYKDDGNDSEIIGMKLNRVRSPRRSVLMISPVPQNIVPGLSSKICMHGATCVKYGCTFSHPACRPVDCPDGESCTIIECAMHHPRSRPIPQFKSVPYCRYGVHCKQPCCRFRHPTPNTPPRCRNASSDNTGFKLGQVVQVQFNGSEWTTAKIQRIRGAKLTVKLDGCEDIVDVPRMSARQLPTRNEGSKIESKIGEEMSVDTNTRASDDKSPMSKVVPDMSSLLALKQIAIEREDFLEAQRLKLRIGIFHRLEKLQLQKAEAIRHEDFLQAQQIKNQLKELEMKLKVSDSPTYTSDEAKVVDDLCEDDILCQHVRK